MAKKRKMLLCPFQSGGFVPVECDGDKCELWQKAEHVAGMMVQGHCSVYWSGLIARADAVKQLGVALKSDVQT